jgi:hypothetical protein
MTSFTENRHPCFRTGSSLGPEKRPVTQTKVTKDAFLFLCPKYQDAPWMRGPCQLLLSLDVFSAFERFDSALITQKQRQDHTIENWIAIERI